MTRPLLFLIASLWCTPLWAFSGADYLRAENNFRDGFAWGIATYQIQVTGALDQTTAQNLLDCFVSGNIGSPDFGDAVARYIEGNPDTLSINAVSAVIRTSRAMCPGIE